MGPQQPLGCPKAMFVWRGRPPPSSRGLLKLKKKVKLLSSHVFQVAKFPLPRKRPQLEAFLLFGDPRIMLDFQTQTSPRVPHWILYFGRMCCYKTNQRLGSLLTRIPNPPPPASPPKQRIRFLRCQQEKPCSLDCNPGNL